jgi:hypothetical protein
MIFLVKNGNEAYRNRFVDRETIIQALKTYNYTENKLDSNFFVVKKTGGALVRERAEYLGKLLAEKDLLTEERIAAYRLRFGKVPEWAKEYLEKKSLANKRERGAKGLVSLGKGKKGGGLILNTKNLGSDSSSSDTEEPLPKQRARTDQFFSVPVKFGKSKIPVFNWDKVADEDGSDSDYESKDNVAPLQPKKNPYVGFSGKNKSILNINQNPK